MPSERTHSTNARRDKWRQKARSSQRSRHSQDDLQKDAGNTNARNSEAHADEVVRNEQLIAQLQFKLQTSREEAVAEARKSIMRASQLCALLHEFNVNIIGSEAESSLQINESEKPPLVSLQTRGMTVAYGSLPDTKVKFIGQNCLVIYFSDSEFFAIEIPDSEDKEEILDIFDGSDILLEIKGKLEKKVAIGWDLHLIRLQCTKLFYSRQDSNKEERYIELPNCEIRIDQIDNRDIIVITDPFTNKIHRFRVETTIEKRKDSSREETNNAGSFAQWSALINGFHIEPDTESNDVHALILSMNRELMNLEKEFRNASKFKKLEELVAKLNSIGNISLEQTQEVSSGDTINKLKNGIVEPVVESSRGGIETSDSSCQTENTDDVERKLSSSQTKNDTSTCSETTDNKTTKATVCEISTQTIEKRSRSTSAQTDSTECLDDTMETTSSHNLTTEVPEEEAEKGGKTDNSMDTEDQTSNEQRDTQRQNDAFNSKEWNTNIEVAPTNNNNSAHSKPEPVNSASSQEVCSTNNVLTEESKNIEDHSELRKSNIKVDSLKQKFEKLEDEESAANEDCTKMQTSERSDAETSIDVKATAMQFKDLKFVPPSPIPRKHLTPTSNIPPFIPPPVPNAPPPPMPGSGKEKKKSTYKGPKLKPVHWEGTKFTPETKAILEEAEQNDELLQLTDEDKLMLQSTFAAETKKKTEPKFSTTDKPDFSKTVPKMEKTSSTSSVKRKPVLNLDIDTARKLEFFVRENRSQKNPLFPEEKKGPHHFLLVFFKKDDSDKEKEFVRQLQSFLPKEEKQLKQYKDVGEDDLELVTTTERQMLTLCRTPEVIKKVQILANLARISEEASLIEQNVESCIVACNQILANCKEFNIFLKLLVDSGNYLNEGATGSLKNKIDTLDLVKALPNISNMKTKEQLLPIVMQMAKVKKFDIAKLANDIAVGHHVSFLTSLAGNKSSTTGNKNTSGFSILRIPLESLSVLIEKTAQILNMISKTSKETTQIETQVEADEQLFLDSCKSFLDEKGRFKSIPAHKSLDDLEILYRALLQQLSLKENTCPCAFFDTIDTFAKKLKQLVHTI